MPRTEALRGVPDSDVEEVMEDFRSDGATNVTKTRENGTWTVTAIFSDAETQPGSSSAFAPAEPPSAPAAGIDVSHHQGAIDWAAVARSGVAFAFIKATQGSSLHDARFLANWAAVKAAGVIRGAYHFFAPLDPVADQVSAFTSTVGTLGDGDLPPVLDVEEDVHQGIDRWIQVPLAERVPLVVGWLTAVQTVVRRLPLLYVRRGFLAEKMGDFAALTAYPLWIADYGAVSAPRLPTGWAGWRFWQRSEKGAVSGIAGDVDHDFFDGSRADLVQWIASTNR